MLLPREEASSASPAYRRDVRRELLGRWILPIRLIPLVLAIGYIGLFHAPLVPTPADWTAAILSTALITVQGRWPLPAVLLQAAMLPGFTSAATLGITIVNMVSCFALGELAWRRSGWQVWLGAAALLIANLAAPASDNFILELVQTVVTLSGPLLLGMHLRSVQEIAWQAKERAAADAQAARADERTAIARELHDLVAHHVASMVLRIGVARHVLNTDPKVAQVLDEVHASGTAAMADLRALVSVLRADQPAVATDLLASLQAAVERVEAAGPSVRASIDPAVAEVDAVLRLAVLRVVQEGLTNVLKHAGPQAKVLLEVRHDCQAVEVSLSDDGPPPPGSNATSGHRQNAAAHREAPGHGLIGMRERVELAGGQLTAGPSGDGWRVHARLPA